MLNGVWQGERKSAEKDALLSLGLLWLTLACSKLVCFCGGCACYLSFRFVFGKERGNSSEKVAKARRKTACIRADTEKMPQKMTATCHTRPQASLHKYKAAGINERQQEHKEPGAKNTDEYCSKNRWMDIVIEQRRWMDIVIEQWCSLEEAKQKKARAGCRNLSSTTTASQPKKADIIQCALSIFAGGASGTRWRGECLMKCLSQDVKASCSV